MIDKIKKLFSELGISEVGFVQARVFSERQELLKKEVPFVGDDVQARINPFLIMENARSIIVYLLPYKTSSVRTNLSAYARGEDYHSVASRIGDAVACLLSECGFSGKAFSDNGILDDRYLAYLAGLGFYGKNGLIINEKYGTYTFIGYIVTDVKLGYNSPIERGCIGCGACVSSCPGVAISDGEIDFLRCASYLTQKKGELTAPEADIIKKSGYVWGCDICQDVCPHNEGVKNSEISYFCDNLVDEVNELDMSNKEFLHKYRNRAFTWRGAGVLRRNVDIMKN